MGSGKRFSYKMNKNDETTPGPGMYSNIELNSIKLNTSRSKNGSILNSKLGFGVGKEQNDKLQGFG